MTTRILQVDAFTDTPFAGNPAAVALFDGPRHDEVLQSVAFEMNLSETAFPLKRPDGDWDLRWFTPATEVDLCGHATLATAHVLLNESLLNESLPSHSMFSENLIDGDEVRFHTRSGVLTCRRADDGRIVMDFPSSPAEVCDPVPGLSAALGVEVVAQGRSFDLLVEVESPEAVAKVSPDFGALAAIDTRAVVVTAAGDVDGGPADFVSRVFAPRVGIDEDPVTGSAHCITGPWWAARLGSTDLAANQISARGGRLGVQMLGERVELTGSAVTVMDGTLLGV